MSRHVYSHKRSFAWGSGAYARKCTPTIPERTDEQTDVDGVYGRYRLGELESMIMKSSKELVPRLTKLEARTLTVEDEREALGTRMAKVCGPCRSACVGEMYEETRSRQMYLEVCIDIFVGGG